LFSNRENELGASLIVEMDGKKTRLMKPSKQPSTLRDNSHDFTFDYSYWSLDDNDEHFASQEQVFMDLGTDVVDCAFQGYNFCVFAYGQTGSGKTYTMMGRPQEKDSQGLVPRICRALFNRMKTGQEDRDVAYKTQVSYLEIYNERVRDLLGPQNVGHALRVREHRVHGPYVENLSQHSVNNYDDIHECMTRGNMERTTASTNMNDTSSRSHAIFTITFVQAGFCDGLPSETVSKIHLVDLAGSERANATGATGQRLKEGAHINKSLVTLGSVISSLAEMSNPNGSKKFYIPYRDSTLTWLLKDSLGGNSKTIMLAAISPADCNYSETLSTLRYANRAKNIINKPTINEDTNVKLIRELREEISSLRAMLQNGSISLKEPQLLENLQKKEAQEKVLISEWSEKWREVQSILREEKSLGLKKSGVGVTLDSEKPHLIGINDEITGVTLFTLKDGETLIGTDEACDKQDIVLTGLGICAEHCKVVLENGTAMIHPYEGAQCWLNANLIDQPTAISQGDILLLGRTNMFRYNNPMEMAKFRKTSTRNTKTDLSRLSLIAASRENLCNSFMSDDDGSQISNNSSPYKARYQQHFIMSEQVLRDNQEIQDEHRKILETIEGALKQLNIERVKMKDHFQHKVQRCSKEIECMEKKHSDKLLVIDCKIEELLAKQEMVLWEKNNEQTQVSSLDFPIIFILFIIL
jgi:kinesin family member 16B